MVKRSLLLVVALLLATPAGANSKKVFYFDHSTDFSKFKTYAWDDIGPQDHVDPIGESIKRAVDAELTAKGLKKADPCAADFLIRYRTAIDTEEQSFSFDDFDTGSPGTFGILQRGYEYSSLVTTRTLGIYLYSQSDTRLIWQGVVTRTANPKAKLNKQRKNITKSVAEILKNYPPKERPRK